LIAHTAFTDRSPATFLPPPPTPPQRAGFFIRHATPKVPARRGSTFFIDLLGRHPFHADGILREPLAFDAEGPGAPGFFIRHSAFDAEGPGAPGFDILQRSCGKPFSHAFLRESPPDPARRQSDREFLHGPANSDGSAIRASPLFQRPDKGTARRLQPSCPHCFKVLRRQTCRSASECVCSA
jgi:hypothetical protein